MLYCVDLISYQIIPQGNASATRIKQLPTTLLKHSQKYSVKHIFQIILGHDSSIYS